MDTTLLKSDSLNIKDQDKNAKLQGLLYNRELKRSTTENQFYQLMPYLMTLSFSNSDETDNLCLDNLAPYIKTLFDEFRWACQHNEGRRRQPVWSENLRKNVVQSI